MHSKSPGSLLNNCCCDAKTVVGHVAKLLILGRHGEAMESQAFRNLIRGANETDNSSFAFGALQKKKKEWGERGWNNLDSRGLSRKMNRTASEADPGFWSRRHPTTYAE